MEPFYIAVETYYHVHYGVQVRVTISSNRKAFNFQGDFYMLDVTVKLELF